MAETAKHSRGRPAVGERFAVRFPADVLDAIDRRAAGRGQSRAAVIRALVSDALGERSDVDRAQIRRMLAMSPADRIRHMTEVASNQSRLRGAARRASK